MTTLRTQYPYLEGLGWIFSYEVNGSDLLIDLWFGDCSIEPTTKADPSLARFSLEDIKELDTGDLEQLDEGVLPGSCEVEELSPSLLVYSLGIYLRKELGEEVMGDELYWATNQTEGLYQFLSNYKGDSLEDLSYGELEGTEVWITRWPK